MSGEATSKCAECGHVNSAHNDLGYCQRQAKSYGYCPCDSTPRGWSGPPGQPREQQPVDLLERLQRSIDAVRPAAVVGGEQHGE